MTIFLDALWRRGPLLCGSVPHRRRPSLSTDHRSHTDGPWTQGRCATRGGRRDERLRARPLLTPCETHPPNVSFSPVANDRTRGCGRDSSRPGRQVVERIDDVGARRLVPVDDITRLARHEAARAGLPRPDPTGTPLPSTAPEAADPAVARSATPHRQGRRPPPRLHEVRPTHVPRRGTSGPTRPVAPGVAPVGTRELMEQSGKVAYVGGRADLGPPRSMTSSRWMPREPRGTKKARPGAVRRHGHESPLDRGTRAGGRRTRWCVEPTDQRGGSGADAAKTIDAWGPDLEFRGFAHDMTNPAATLRFLAQLLDEESSDARVRQVAT